MNRAQVDNVASNSESVTVPTQIVDLVRKHLETHAALLGRSTQLGQFFAEGARRLLQEDLEWLDGQDLEWVLPEEVAEETKPRKSS